MRAALERINQSLNEEKKTLNARLNTVTEATRNITEKMGGSSTLAPLSAPLSRFSFRVQDQYQELVRLASLRSEEHTSELQSLMRTSYAGFCLKKNNKYLYI